MSKKGCCCNNNQIKFYNCCPPIGTNCVGKTINFEFQVSLRYPCIGAITGPANARVYQGATYTCSNGKQHPIVNNLETWLITVSHTIENPAQVPITDAEWETPDDTLPDSTIIGAAYFPNYACCPDINPIGQPLQASYYDCLYNPRRPMNDPVNPSEQGCNCASGPRSLCNFVPKDTCEYYDLTQINPEQNVDNMYLRCFSRYNLLGSPYSNTSYVAEKSRQNMYGQTIIDKFCRFDYTTVPVVNYSVTSLTFPYYSMVWKYRSPPRVEDVFNLGIQTNIGQNYTAQFIPNPSYPEQMEDDYIPIATPVIAYFGFNCNSTLTDPAVNGEPDTSNPSQEIVGGSLLSAGFIHAAKILMGFSYKKQFNCGTINDPITEILEIPFKTIVIDDHKPFPIYYMDGSHNYNPNCYVDCLQYNIDCYEDYPPCQPTKRYTFSSPWFSTTFRRQLQPSDKMTDCVPKSTQTVPFAVCKQSCGSNNTYFKDDYTTCNPTSADSTYNWQILTPDHALQQFQEEYSDYGSQFAAQDYKWGDINTVDGDGQPVIIKGICSSPPLINFEYEDGHICRKSWNNFPSRIDVSSS